MSRDFSTSWLMSHLARKAASGPIAATSKAVKREADLHEAIRAECLRRGWLAFHGSMAHKTFRTAGEPDFVILCDGGRVLLVEAKAKAGKPSTEQLGVHAWARKLGHQVWVVRSVEEFMEAIKCL